MIASGQTLRRVKPVYPFEERKHAFGMTYGLGPAGYDVRLDQDLVLRPGEFRLASTIEHFVMPRNMVGIVHDKSTWARMGLSVFNTVIEPGWSGFLTLELANQNPERRWWQFWRCEEEGKLILRKGMPIAQVLFHMTDHPVMEPYAGKYQNQARGPQPARLEAVRTKT